ncbi:MAG: VanZ family protein [Geminicoccaceae bacterium]|nr:VanZ family protein [Geminicoccaceae bacterium]
MSEKATRRVVVGIVLLTVFMSGLTLLVFNGMARYELGPPGFIVNPDFEMGSDELLYDEPMPPGWTRSGRLGSATFSGNWLMLDNGDPRVSVGVEQVIDLPPGVEAFEIGGMVEIQAVIGGEMPWHRARIDLVSLNAAGKPDFRRPHKLFDAVGTRPAYRYSRIVEVMPEAAQARLSIRLARATGRIAVSDLTLRPAYERAEFQQMATIVKVGWALLLGLVGLWFVATAAHRPAAVAAVGLLFVGGLFAILPYEIKDPIIDLILPVRGRQDFSEREWTGHAMHALAFVVLGFLVRVARRRDPMIKVLLALVLVSAVAELLQALSTGIGMDDLYDELANIIGIVVGVGAGEEQVRRMHTRRRRHRRIKRSSPRSRDPDDTPGVEAAREPESSPV